MKKRILSCLMALALCLTLLPTTALAEEAGEPVCGAGRTAGGLCRKAGRGRRAGDDRRSA